LFRNNLEEYYIAVNQLLSETRAQEEPNTSVLLAMKSVVLACKSLTQDCEEYEETLKNNRKVIPSKLPGLKGQLSQALTNQMLTAKQAAVDPTDAVKQSVENALLPLTTVVLLLAKTLSETKELSPPRSGNGAAIGGTQSSLPVQNTSLKDLKIFLEQQTDSIVQSIQYLLALIRQSNYSKLEFNESVQSIASIVSSLTEASTRPMSEAGIDCREVLRQLSRSRDGLLYLAEKIEIDPNSKGLKQQVASSSYEIAKHVKTLISLIR